MSGAFDIAKSAYESENAIIFAGDAIDVLSALPPGYVDAVITDPPYPEVSRSYGRLSVGAWEAMMKGVVREVRRVLRPHGSAVFVLQPNSERLGRVRPWLFDFMAVIARDWNLVQDVWWWNHSALPTAHSRRDVGLLRPSVKACVWAGSPGCFRNQDAVLWEPAGAVKALKLEDRAIQRRPSGHSVRPDRIASAVVERGGATPFNLLPIANANPATSAGSKGHGSGTPGRLCDWWVRYITKPGDVVLDPFIGSGTVGESALWFGRKIIGIEKNSDYVTMCADTLAHTTFRWGLK